MGIFRGSRLFSARESEADYFFPLVENVVAAAAAAATMVVVVIVEREREIRLGIIKWLRGDLAWMDRYAGRGKVELSRCLLIDAIVVRRC